MSIFGIYVYIPWDFSIDIPGKIRDCVFLVASINFVEIVATKSSFFVKTK